MLKGHVFSKQLFGHPIFALFINTFLNGKNGVSDNYKNGMAINYSGSNVTVQSGAVCIQGRFLEEDTSTSISAGTDSSYCKLVIEINLDKQNTESEFLQGVYKIVKGASSYPNLTQTNIVKNNSGIYQYELARFRTSNAGISDFKDMRTFLNFQSIYDAIQTEYREILEQLEKELANVKDGSAYLLKTIVVQETNTSLDNYREEGRYWFDNAHSPTGRPNGATTAGFLEVFREGENYFKQIWYNHYDNRTFIRTHRYDGWVEWAEYVINEQFATVIDTVKTPAANSGGLAANKIISYPGDFTKDNCVIISVMSHNNDNSTYKKYWYTPSGDLSALSYMLGNSNIIAGLTSDGIYISSHKIDDVQPAQTVEIKITLMKIS